MFSGNHMPEKLKTITEGAIGVSSKACLYMLDISIWGQRILGTSFNPICVIIVCVYNVVDSNSAIHNETLTNQSR